MLPESTDVLIAGAGPAGLSCAVSLLSRGFKNITIVDAHPAGLNLSRAIVIHARTLEDLETLGCVDQLMLRGIQADYMTVRTPKTILAKANFVGLGRRTEYPYALLISQSDTEKILEDRLNALGVTILRPYKVAGLETTDAGIRVKFETGEVIQTRYLVGADGSRSTVRTLAQIPFRDPLSKKEPQAVPEKQGESVKEENARLGKPLVIADVQLSGDIPESIRPKEFTTFLSSLGFLLLVPLAPSPDDPLQRPIYRISGPAEHGAADVPSQEYLQKMMNAALGLPSSRAPVIDNVIFSSRFRVKHAVADTFYKRMGAGVVVLAGDAAHVHSPAGGQGMNLGIRDAINLGITLADAIRHDGSAATPTAKLAYLEKKLSKYSKERRKMALKVIKMTKVMTWATGLESTPARAARNTVWWILGRGPVVNNKLALRLSGLQMGESVKTLY